MSRFWQSEIWRVLLIALLGLGLGAAFDSAATGLLIAVFGYLAWHVYNAAALNRWLGEHATAELPESHGPWADIFLRIHAMRKSHRQEAERLNALLDRYRQTTKALPEAAVTLGTHGEIELVNEAATKLLGIRVPQDLGSPITNIVRAPEFVDFVGRNRFDEVLEMQSPQDDRLALAIRVVPYMDGEKRLLLARDVSRLHKLEQIRRDFIANVSHEMKSPLTVVKGYVESMRDDTGAFCERWKKPLAQIDQQTDRLCRIVEDLLQLSNLETAPASDDAAAVDVPKLIHSITTEAKALGGDQHVFEVDVDPQVCLRGNFNELYSAFSNLAFNAVRYTEAGGRIRLSWFVGPDGSGRFRVEDTGVGIGAEHIPRLTERFYRVDQARSRELGGTGLGLAIVKHVLIRHAATLAIESEPGKGSVFTCRFPAERLIIKPEAQSA